MEKIKRSIRLFFVKYGRLLFDIMAIVVAFILGLRVFNNIYKQDKELEQENIIVKSEEQILEETKKENGDIQFISKFIEYCNNNEIEKAYNMISENCKKEKYTNINKFKDEYIDRVFNVDISKYEVLKSNDNNYTVILTEDVLEAGKYNSTKIQQIKIEEFLEKKMYIIE